MPDLPDTIRALQKVTDHVAAGRDLDETLGGLSLVLTDIVGARRWSIMLKSTPRQMRIQAALGIPEHVIKQAMVEVGQGIAGQVAETGEGGLIRDVQHESGHTSGGLYAAGSAICVPIRLRGEVLGVINLNDKRGEHGEVVEFDENDLTLALIIANQAAVAIDAARAMERTRDQQRLEAMRQALEERVGALETQAAAFEVVREVIDSMVMSGNLDEVLNGVVEGTTRLLNATRGSLMLRDEQDTDVMYMRAAVGIPEEIVRSAGTRLGEGIAGSVAASGNALLLRDAAQSREQLGEDERDSGYRNVSAICVPVRIRGETLGVININDRSDGREFTESDLILAEVIANQAAVAIRNARLTAESVAAAERRRDLDIARRIQQSFIPEPPDMAGIRIARRALPCDAVGGDYLDFLPVRDGQGHPTGANYLICGDVSGHGISAALIMATARAFTHALLRKPRELVEVMERLNNLVEANTRPDQYLTLFVGLLEKDGRRLVYSSGGHEPALLYHAATDRFSHLESTGMPLGMFAGMSYGSAEVELHAGDILVLFTDGIPEAVNSEGEYFGRQRLEKAVRELRDREPDYIIEELRRRLTAFCLPEPFRDDFSIVVVINPAP